MTDEETKPVALTEIFNDPMDIIKANAKILAQLKVMALVAEARRKMIDRAAAKFNRTHEFLFAFQPRSHSGKFEKNEEGKLIPVTKPDTRQVFNKETKKTETVPVHVTVHKFIGWDDGKKFSGADLRAIRKKQTDAAIGDQTHYADGSPILRPSATPEVAHV